MQILGESVRFRYLERCGKEMEFPETHYKGEYIKDIAENIYSEHGAALAEDSTVLTFKESAETIIFSSIKKTLERLGIRHDSFF